MLQIKTIPKNISTIGILLLHPSFINNYKFSEETTQRKHKHVTQLFLANVGGGEMYLAFKFPTILCWSLIFSV